MIDKIVAFPHPTLRHRSKPVRRVDNELRDAIQKMFELMYSAKGVGLAANQVDLPLRIFIINTAGAPGEGEELVLINPVILQAQGTAEQEEGCLSLPGLYAPVRRPDRVKAEAYSLTGEKLTIEADGLLGRAIQHELDHLDGVLFIDRLSDTLKMAVRPELEDFAADFEMQRRLGAYPSDEAIQERTASLEARYCS